MADSVLREAALRACAYLEGLTDRHVAAREQGVARLHELNTSFPEEPVSAGEILRILDEFGSPATMASAGGRYFDFVTGGTLPQALAASWMVSAWDQNATLTVMSPAASFFEELALPWVKEVFGLPGAAGRSGMDRVRQCAERGCRVSRSNGSVEEACSQSGGEQEQRKKGTDTEFRRDAFMLRVGELAAEFKSVPIFRPVRQVLPHDQVTGS